ncbi:hypothetical protein CAPTEDRAFT_215557 [Capitella teleta]|uniref:Uncharacterized protein n=1 Tax=Capitella teleta TaxID=283909 RepID=R7U8T6_CAPTE|nr:hypothetical protein CAPTEDRAFT_215557 [Capitella teleta]|eukprot:ELU02775.1 hypothetical protein CAPTEDRAFT_215557 [Capitella teleta]
MFTLFIVSLLALQGSLTSAECTSDDCGTSTEFAPTSDHEVLSQLQSDARRMRELIEETAGNVTSLESEVKAMREQQLSSDADIAAQNITVNDQLAELNQQISYLNSTVLSLGKISLYAHA